MKSKTSFQYLLLIVFLAVTCNAFSQKPPERFGKISNEHLAGNVCPIDPNAHAWFIFDYGKSYFQYASTEIRSNDPSKRKGFQLYSTRHFRLKIADNQGFDWANIEIPLYRDDDKEQITSIKAQTYNLENGKIKVTKLDRKDLFYEETSQNWITAKFAMPDIREGSVIEVEYSIKSDFFFNLRPWHFQKTIPVLKSEYHVSIPEYFNFNQTQKGYFPLQWSSEKRHRELKLNYHQQAEGMVAKKETYSGTFRYEEIIFHFDALEVPAFPEEEFLRTANNYLTKVEFELHSTKFPNSMLNTYTSSWETINKNLQNNNNFGRELGKTSHLKDDIAALKQMHQNENSLLTGAFELVKNKMTWNGSRNKYVSSSLGKAWKEGAGNCADINLNLVNLLSELGFKSYPVIISTQDNGIIFPVHPSVSSFNYVIAMVEFEGETLLMDATDPLAEINLLPVRCLNDKGRIVNNSGGDWINLMDMKPWAMQESYFMGLDENLELKGKNHMMLKDYAKYQYLRRLKNLNDPDEYKNSVANPGVVIEDLNVAGLDSTGKDIAISFNFKNSNYVEKANDLVLFKPAYQPFIAKNPFKLEERAFPVEYNYPYNVKQIYSITLPANYTIVELPKSLNVKIPDGNIQYIYNISQLGNTIFLSIMFSLDRTLFLPDEYETLKNIYQMIIDKQNENIVLKIS